MMRRNGPPAQPAAAAACGEPQRKVRVWDLPTRLFHWLTAALVAAAYATWRLNWIDWHAWIGEALLALVLWRLLWGVLGSETARFARFLAAPTAVLRHLAQLRDREPDRQVGHNPAGGWMVVLLLALLLAQCLTGIYVENDVADAGPLTPLTPAPVADLITALHALLWDALLAAVVLHLVAIVFYRVAKGHNLLLPMISGWKRVPLDTPVPRSVGLGRALLALAAAAVAAAALASLT
jgi:cytochrome b